MGTKFSDDLFEPNLKTRSKIDPLGVEIIESTSPDGVIAKFLRLRGEGLNAISFKVADLDKAVEELQAKGLRLVNRVEGGNLREAQFHPKDSFGVMIELAEYNEVHGAVLAALKKT